MLDRQEHARRNAGQRKHSLAFAEANPALICGSRDAYGSTVVQGDLLD
jgi:hypothetical protein